MRRSLGIGALALALTGCSTLDALNPFAKSAPKLKPAELPVIESAATLAPQWQAAIGAAGAAVFTPAVVGERVFVAARDGSLACLQGGRTLWRIAAGQPLSGGVGANDQLVVVGTPKGEVLAFHAADGRPAWQARASSEILAAPALDAERVVVRSGDARIHGFSAADGQRRWTYQRSTPTLALRSHAGVTLAGTRVLAGFPGGKLVALAAADGVPQWEVTVAQPRGTTELERIADVAGEPAASGDTVCAAAYQGRVACFDLNDGRALWSRELSSLAGLTIGRQAVYVTDAKSSVHALALAGGAPLWQQDKLALRDVGRPLIVGDLPERRLAVADFQGYVHLLDAADGRFVARAATDGSPVRAALQTLPGSAAFAVQTQSGGVFALAAP